MKVGFEWFVAWRYLRTRSRRASPVPLAVGVFLIVCAAAFFALGVAEPPKPTFRFSVEPDWRRLTLVAGVVTSVVGLAFAVFAGLRKWVSDAELFFGKLGLWLAQRRPAAPTPVRPIAWWPVIAGLAIAASGITIVYYAVLAGQPMPTTRVVHPLEQLTRAWPRLRPIDDWFTRTPVAGWALVGLAALAVLHAAARVVAARRAGATDLDLLSRSRAGGPLVAALVLVAAGVTWLNLAERPDSLQLRAFQFATVDWDRVWLAAGLGAMAVGVLVAVFGVFYMMQSIFTAISTYGVFLGTWALVVALSVMNGFETDLRQKILGASAHVLVSREDGVFTEWRAVQDRVAQVPGVVAVTPFKQSEVVIAANSNYAGVIVKGIDPKTVGRVTDLEKNLEHEAKLERLWPILDDGGPGEYSRAADAGPIGLPGPDAGDGADPDVPPIDFSGEEGEGGEPAAPAGAPAGPAQGADPDAVPEDFSDDGELGETDEDDDFALPPDVDADRLFMPNRPGRGGPGRDPLLDFDLGPSTTIIESPLRAGKGGTRPSDPRVAGLDGILVGRELAKNLHLWVGQEVQVVSPLPQDTPAGQVPRVRSFRIAGIFFSGMYEYDTKYAYVTMPALQGFLSLGDEADGIEIKVKNHEDTDAVLAALRAELGPAYRVQDWKEINRSLFSALKLEKIAMFLVLTIIILVASFSIISNLIMIVVEKAREVAILKALGASDTGVLRVFVIEGSYIGLLGTAFGISLGVLTCWALERFGLPLDPDVYYIDKLPVAMDLMNIVFVALAGVAISFIATIYPSYVAARLRPVEGLRWE